MPLGPEEEYFHKTDHYAPITYETVYGILNSGIEKATSTGAEIKLLVTFLDKKTQEVAHETVYDLSTPWTIKHQEQIAYWMRRSHRVRVLEARQKEPVRNRQEAM